MPTITVSPVALEFLRGRQALIYEARYRGCCGGQVFELEISLFKGAPPTGSELWRQEGAMIWYPASLDNALEIKVDLARLLGFKKLTITIPKLEG